LPICDSLAQIGSPDVVLATAARVDAVRRKLAFLLHVALDRFRVTIIGFGFSVSPKPEAFFFNTGVGGVSASPASIVARYTMSVSLLHDQPWLERDNVPFRDVDCLARSGNAVKDFSSGENGANGRSRSRETSGDRAKDPNSHEFGYRNGSRRCRSGIARLPGGPPLNLEDAEVAKFDSAFGCQRFQDGIQDHLDDQLGLRLVDICGKPSIRARL
jgi:hypothetical protein